MAILKIKLKGFDHSLFHTGDDSGFDLYQFDQAYTVESPTRGDVPEQLLELGDDKIVEFQFEDETVWLGDNESITMLFPKEVKRSADGDELFLPDELESEEQDRGVFSKVAIKLIKIFVKKTIIKPKMVVMAHNLENKQLAFSGVDFKEVQYGVLTACSPEIELSSLKFKTSGEADLEVKNRYLLFLHGTGSSTLGSFGELKDSEDWKKFIIEYGADHLLSYQHRTLTTSPIQNILQLVNQLPAGIELDLLSHSRGGLLADLLARFSTDSKGFDAIEKSLLDKNNREMDLRVIKEIEGILTAKEITIRSMVRVACPANGTTLASNRLNIFLNVTFNLAGLAVGQIGNPIFVAFKEFIMEAVASKDDVDVLPGLEAMGPQSPFIKALNYQASDIEVDFPLYVVGGSSELSVSFKSLVVILGKLFFMRKNDLVVDTESMTWGARRKPGKVFVCIEKSDAINHFKYFSNPETLKAVLAGLSAEVGDVIEDFELKLIASDRGFAGLDYGAYKRDKVSGQRPIALVIPGIMGSNLGDSKKIGKRDELLWINYWSFLTGNLIGMSLDPTNETKLTPHSLIKTSYGELGEKLEETYDVVTFEFDWRIPLKVSAARFERKIQDLLTKNQPIKIVAHSMGGVLVRDFIVYHQETWEKLNTSLGFRAVLLGSPLGGSYRIPYVLFGKDSMIKLLGKIDIKHSTKELLSVFCNFHGILNLLPMSNNTSLHDFSDRRLWERMRAASGDDSWPIPSVEVLKEFAAHQKMVLSNVDKIDYSNITYIAGQSGKKSFTISNLDIVNGELVFYATNAGDESVTWMSGIPKSLHDRNQVYYVNVTHGGLSKERNLFAAIEELMVYGSTKRLQNSLPKTRGEEKDFAPTETEIFDISEENVLDTILGIVEQEAKWQEEKPVLISVSHGDLKYAKFPVLAGHFKFDAILTTELAIDRQLSGELARLHGLGLYPGDIGSNQVVLNEDYSKTTFKGGVIVGLGVPGELSGFALMKSVEKGVARYLTIRKENANSQRDGTTSATTGISVIAIANAYGGLTTESSVRAIILGIQHANRSIHSAYKGKIKGIEEIEVIEIFNDKALAILKTIQRLEVDDSKEFNVVFSEKRLNYKLGRLWRIPYDNANDWWTRVSVCHEMKLRDTNEFEEVIRMSIASNGASEKVEHMPANDKTLQVLLKRMTQENQYSPEIAKTMFELLIPYQFKEEVKRLSNVSWILDVASAEYPWEMIQEDVDAVPLCVHTGMIRQLATMQFRQKIARVTAKTALVVGDPILEKYMPQLLGAKREAETVVSILRKNDYQIQSLISSTAADIILKLFSRNHKIIHLAGHGVFNYGPNRSTGMVIGYDTFLTPAQIAGMSSSAEMVFVNCCYLGAIDKDSEERSQYRNKFAANIGTQLINNGARAVIVAGWAVDDAAALEFARQFYENMFDGLGFGESVKRARKGIYKNFGRRTNTWGAFQCYGDPFYKLTEEGVWRGHEDELLVCEEVEIELQNIYESMFANEYNQEKIVGRIDEIMDKLHVRNMLNDKIQELSAGIYAGLQEYEKSCACYEKLLKSKKSEFTIRSFERYCNTQAKFTLQQFASGKIEMKDAIKMLDKVIDDLQGLSRHFGESAERWSLLGSTYKRKLHLLNSSSPKAMSEALSLSIHAYKEASRLSDHTDAYPLTNWLTMAQIQLLLEGKKGVKHIDLDARKAMQKIFDENSSNSKAVGDFWKMAHQANILLTQFLMDTTKPSEVNAKVEAITAAYLKLWKLAGNKGQKIGELEHFEIIAAVLGNIENEKAKALSPLISRIKKELKEGL
ncbi:lecithin:cholesterol acyltransferase [Algoriphagus ratkowskyi]|uniref:CHAT domain-containing protein n=1 Tax=Algoriphagus ratkowskyi TaxID=57028 RepID=A0A2W7QU36_9BACT|nr:CHAT domain-containing protein [Algoriphagus ratkowskyi]PZX52093.1 lecithin:cholesterol acyltransferase [Algoriphagus ratkowskyi]TXD76140.1 CHAT domain-containing protein [Algoriphagus ratkowskyi]